MEPIAISIQSFVGGDLLHCNIKPPIKMNVAMPAPDIIRAETQIVNAFKASMSFQQLTSIVDEHVKEASEDGRNVQYADRLYDVLEQHGEMKDKMLHVKSIGVIPTNRGS